MKKRSSYCFHFFLLFIITASANAQQEYTQVAARENSYCNSTCTLINLPELNANRNAIVFAIPITENGYEYPHPIGVHFINNKWSIINLDQQSMPAGSKFTVQYFSKPDLQLQFVHTVSMENLAGNNTRSFIDHAGLNDNPQAQFRFISNGNGNGNNMYNIRIGFDSSAGKWYVYSIKKRPLDTNIAFNIILTSKSDVTISTHKRKDEIPVDSPKATNIQNLPTAINKADKPPLKDPKTILANYDFSQVHICIDKKNPNPLPEKAKPFRIPKLKPNGELDPVATITQGLSGLTDRMWSPGDTITVGFNPSTPFILGKIKAFAVVWESVANIKFKFLSDIRKAQVKVGFINDNTSWSYIGRDALNHEGVITLNFGWFDANTSDAE